MGKRELEVFVDSPINKYPADTKNFNTLYEGDGASTEKTVLGFCIRNENNYHERIGLSGNVLIKNARVFIEDLKKRQKSNPDSHYSFEKEGIPGYIYFEEGDVVGNCLICNKDVKAEGTFVAFPGDIQGDGYPSPAHEFDAIHMDYCLDEFIVQLENTLETSDIVVDEL